jgi:probable HAF family extracellular repeat protein
MQNPGVRRKTIVSIFFVSILCFLAAIPLHAGSFTLTYIDLGYGNSYAYAMNSSGQVAGTAVTASGSIDPFLYSAGQVYDLGSLGGTYGSVGGLNNSGQVVGDSYNAGNAFPLAYVTTGGPTGGTMINIAALDGTLTLSSGNGSDSDRINDSGQVLGGAQNPQQTGFLYNTTGGTLALFGSNGGEYLNASGQIAGYTNNSPDDLFIYSGGNYTDLGDLGGVGISNIAGLNSSGEIAGGAQMDYSGTFNAFLYNGTSMMNLGTLGGTSSSATGLNDSGVVVGYSELSGNTQYDAFSYSGGTMTDLGNLGGTFASAYGINDAGQIWGQGTTAAGNSNGFLYSNGTMTNIGTLGGDNTYVQYMDDSGDIIGTSETTGDASVDPFFYDAATGQMTDLLSLFTGPFTEVDFEGLNDAGDIYGTAIDPYYGTPNDSNISASEAFLITPGEESPTGTPEPGSLLLLGTGLSCLAGWRRKKRSV